MQFDLDGESEMSYGLSVSAMSLKGGISRRLLQRDVGADSALRGAGPRRPVHGQQRSSPAQR